MGARRFGVAACIAAVSIALGLGPLAGPGGGGGPAVAAAMAQSDPLNRREGFSGLPVPRFVSLRFDDSVVRQGPTTNHRQLYRYEGLAGMPLKIVAETERWRRVEDWEGDEGWIHQSQLQGARGAYVDATAGAMLHEAPDADSPAVARLGRGVMGRLGSCNDSWCAFSAGGYDGWIRRASLWGVLEGEAVR